MPSRSSFSSLFAYGLLGLVALATIVGLLSPAFKTDDTSAASATADQATVEETQETVTKILNSVTGDYLREISLRGAISSTPDNSGFIPADSAAMQVVKALDAAAKDKRVKGILLSINSPGGTVGMSQELNKAVLRAQAKKPVVASLGDICASGGYYTAVAADRIVANPGTLTASIGVIIRTMNFKELLNNKLGVKAFTFTSGKYKDILSPFRTPRPDELKLVQTLVDDSYQDFLNAVIEGRTKGMEDEAAIAKRAESIKAVADGRIVLGSQALQVGLIDELGDKHHAKDVLRQLVRERFNLNDGAKLPFRKGNKKKRILELLGIDAEAIADAIHPRATVVTSQAELAEQVLPFSAQFPNQPLWIYE